MFKYIKKLTSVVVMFAVIIVFSTSKVYAASKKVIFFPSTKNNIQGGGVAKQGLIRISRATTYISKSYPYKAKSKLQFINNKIFLYKFSSAKSLRETVKGFALPNAKEKNNKLYVLPDLAVAVSLERIGLPIYKGENPAKAIIQNLDYGYLSKSNSAIGTIDPTKNIGWSVKSEVKMENGKFYTAQLGGVGGFRLTNDAKAKLAKDKERAVERSRDSSGGEGGDSM